MEHKHTPGPWRLAGRQVNGAILIRGSEATSEIAVVLQNDRRYSIEANARLIAAAPCMLDALQAIEDFISGNPDAVEPFGIVRTAIAKATGATP